MMKGRTRLRLLILALVIALLLAGCASAPQRAAVAERPVEEGAEERPPVERVPETWTENRGPRLTSEELLRVTVPVPSAWSESREVYTLFAGVVHRYSNSPHNESGFGRFVAIAHEAEFSIGERTERSNFYTVYAELADVSVRPAQNLSAGGTVGSAATGETGVRIGVYTRSDDPIWRRQTGRPPIILNGFYFWDPSFVLSPP